MTSLTIHAFAKINLGLRVVARGEDGFHDISTVLQTIDLYDELLVETADETTLTVEGTYPVPADATNLVMRAATALARRYPGHGARLTLVKRIPPGSGLGGGSADAAAALLGLDRLWALGVDPGLLYTLARGLGADVPFFLFGGTCLAVGRGDEVFPMPDAGPWHVVVVWPSVSLSTREVYEGLGLALTRSRILSSMKGFMPSGATVAERGGGVDSSVTDRRRVGAAEVPRLDNDLEKPAFQMVPGLKDLKHRLLDAGAVAASLSGSGSAVFGLFRSARRLDSLVASLARGGVVVFRSMTLTRDAYRNSMFHSSRK